MGTEFVPDVAFLPVDNTTPFRGELFNGRIIMEPHATTVNLCMHSMEITPNPDGSFTWHPWERLYGKEGPELLGGPFPLIISGPYTRKPTFTDWILGKFI